MKWNGQLEEHICHMERSDQGDYWCEDRCACISCVYDDRVVFRKLLLQMPRLYLL